MDAERSAAKPSSGSERFEVTLRGLRFADHPKNAAGLIRTIVPWRRVRIFKGGHAFTAIILDEDGKPMGSRWRWVTWPVPLSQRHAIRSVMRRADRRSLADGSLDISESDPERGQIRVVSALFPIGVAVCVGGMAWVALSALGGGGGLPPPLQVVSMVVVGAVPAVLAVSLVAAWRFLLWPRATTNARILRLTCSGVQATLFDGRVVSFTWAKVRSIRGGSGVFTIEAFDGIRVRARAIRSAFVLRDWMEKHGKADSEAVALRKILWRALILCQIGGVVGAIVIASGLAQYSAGPVGFYFVTGFVIPVFLWLASAYSDWTERLARSWRIRRRAAQRRAALHRGTAV